MSTWEEWTGIEEGMRVGEEEKEDCIITIMPRLQYFSSLGLPKFKVASGLPSYNSIEDITNL